MKQGAIVVSSEDIQDEWYSALVDECKAIITEAVFTSRWALVEGYHELGERITQDANKQPITKLLQGLAVNLKTSERTLWYAVQFAEKYPDIGRVPEGKNITWNKLITKYLPSPKRDPGTPALPVGKYRVIYADPPWPVDSMVLDKWESPLDDKYQTMTIDEIKALDIASLAADDCSLFLWTTHTYLREAFDVIDVWGFKYHCCITWDKGSGWSLCGFHRMTEFCLYAYKSNINVNQSGQFIPTLIKEKKRKHSQKPDLMYELIESNTPEPRIELFARIQRPGWVPWGNQL